MTSTELVGPLPTVRFGGGPGNTWRNTDPPKVAYVPPRNTLDPRYRACTDHRVACDCREAEMAENINEWRSEYKALKAAVLKHIEGHRTEAEWTYQQIFDHWEDGVQVWRYERDDDAVCSCVGCRIAREAYIS